jgi:hypothetical protein
MFFSINGRFAPTSALSAWLALCAIVAAAAPSAVSAAPMFFSDNLGEFMDTLHDEGFHHDNVMFNNSSLWLQGTTVQGYVDGSDFERVDITSSTPLVAGGGQAPGVAAESGTFLGAVFSPHADNDADLFRSLSFNIDANGNEDKTVMVTLLDEAGDQINQQPYEFVVNNGNNFFGVLGADGFNFASVVLTSSGELDAIAQIRTTLAASGAIPPPPSPTPQIVPTVSSPEASSVTIWVVAVLFSLLFAYAQRRKRPPVAA